MSNSEIYLTSFYFIITTFSTVGYGDISGGCTYEKIFCLIVMVFGVTAFGAGISSLTNLLQTYDTENAKLQEKVLMLNRIYKEYCLPLRLYENVKKSLHYQYNNDIEDLLKFTEQLPQDLRIEVSMFIFERTFKQINFFKNKPLRFIAWICPLLRPLIKAVDQYIFFEKEEMTCIYFYRKGKAGYVLPRQNNMTYVELNRGYHFGVSCIAGSFIDRSDWSMDNIIDRWIITYRDSLRHQFTVQCQDQCEMLTLSISDLIMMRNEFYETYCQLFDNVGNILIRLFRIRIKAINLW